MTGGFPQLRGAEAGARPRPQLPAVGLSVVQDWDYSLATPEEEERADRAILRSLGWAEADIETALRHMDRDVRPPPVERPTQPAPQPWNAGITPGYETPDQLAERERREEMLAVAESSAAAVKAEAEEVVAHLLKEIATLKHELWTLAQGLAVLMNRLEERPRHG